VSHPHGTARAASEPALVVVEAYLRSLADGGRASRSLIRQRGWALREAVLFAVLRARGDLATSRPLTPDERAVLGPALGRVLLGDLFADGFSDDWLAHADPLLRGVTDPVPATQRARTASLRGLADHVGVGRPDHRHGRPVLREVLSPPQLTAALEVLTQRLPGRGPDDHVRLAAVLAVMAVWPARSADLASLRLSQVRDGADGVVLDLEVDGGPPVLRGVAADRLRDWIAVRASLVGALQGGPVHALWVSIRSNSRPGGPRGSLPLPPGMPLMPRGLQRAYARSVESANVHHQERPGFPLPRSLDLLRRSVESG